MKEILQIEVNNDWNGTRVQKRLNANGIRWKEQFQQWYDNPGVIYPVKHSWVTGFGGGRGSGYNMITFFPYYITIINEEASLLYIFRQKEKKPHLKTWLSTGQTIMEDADASPCIHANQFCEQSLDEYLFEVML